MDCATCNSENTTFQGKHLLQFAVGKSWRNAFLPPLNHNVFKNIYLHIAMQLWDDKFVDKMYYAYVVFF